MADRFQVHIIQGFGCILTLKYSTVLLDGLTSQTASSLPNHSYPAAWVEAQNELLDIYFSFVQIHNTQILILCFRAS